MSTAVPIENKSQHSLQCTLSNLFFQPKNRTKLLISMWFAMLWRSDIYANKMSRWRIIVRRIVPVRSERCFLASGFICLQINGGQRGRSTRANFSLFLFLSLSSSLWPFYSFSRVSCALWPVTAFSSFRFISSGTLQVVTYGWRSMEPTVQINSLE